MLDILKKFQLSSLDDQKLIINAPQEYYQLLDENQVSYDTEAYELTYDFIQIFGTSNDELLQHASLYMEYLTDEGVIWLCYPKRRSKKYKNTAVTKDSVSELLAQYKYRPVKQASFDADFSALRFTPEKE